MGTIAGIPPGSAAIRLAKEFAAPLRPHLDAYRAEEQEDRRQQEIRFDTADMGAQATRLIFIESSREALGTPNRKRV